MKTIKNITAKFINDETGASSVVEATFIFPFVIAVFFFVMMLADSYYSKAEVFAQSDYISSKAAKNLQDIGYNQITHSYDANKAIASTTMSPSTNPYRYLEAYYYPKTVTDPLYPRNTIGTCGIKGSAYTDFDLDLDDKLKRASIMNIHQVNKADIQICPGLFNNQVLVENKRQSWVQFMPTMMFNGKLDQSSTSRIVEITHNKWEAVRNVNFTQSDHVDGEVYDTRPKYDIVKATMLEDLKTKVDTIGLYACEYIAGCTLP
ncbi:MAG: hypothetical protein LBN03_00980 [Bifidobacteriaceae bacterium]|jgi:hypothetical protein|nr:hypothetical protein [Bifidobacteriaceae bacterium]